MWWGTPDISDKEKAALCVKAVCEQIDYQDQISLFVVGYCLLTNGMLTIILAVSLLVLMTLVKKVLKPIMYRAGKENQDYYSGLFKWISQTCRGSRR